MDVRGEITLREMFVFQSYIKNLILEFYKQEVEYVMRDPILFGDYKNRLEESEPRLYEDIQDFEAAKALFQEVRIPYIATIKYAANDVNVLWLNYRTDM